MEAMGQLRAVGSHMRVATVLEISRTSNLENALRGYEALMSVGGTTVVGATMLLC